MNKAKKTYLTALILFTIFPTHTRNNDGTRLAIGVIGGVAGGLGLYGLYNWLCDESDEEVLATAQQHMTACKNEYKKPVTMLVNVVRNEFMEEMITPSRVNRYIDRLNERILCELALMKYDKPIINIYRSQLDSTLRNLNSSYNALSKRIIGQNDYIMRNHMQQTMNELMPLIEDVDLFARTLKIHESYFNLYETEGKVAFKYNEELKVIANYNSNLDNQAWAIRQFVIAHSKTSSLPFPRVEYHKIVNRDIEKLESVFNRSSHHYPERMACMRQLIDTLKLIKSFIVTDVAYSQEVTNYERDQRERERIRIEREKADAARRQAEAEESKARAERERVRLEEQKIIEKRKENRLKEKELAQKERERHERIYGY